MAHPYVFVNDAYIPANEATVLISDLSVQRGYGVFDFLKTINNIPIFLENHLDRFYYSVTEMRLQVAQSRDQLKDIIKELMRLNNMPDSGIRITVTGGYSADGYNLAPKSNLIITQQSFVIDPQAVQRGIKLITYNYQRQLPHIKTLDYLKAIWLQPFIKESEADEVLYHNNGVLAECPRANFFIVTQDSKVLTPINNILKGVTRKNILALPQTEIDIEEKEITLEDLLHAKEAFITSTTKNILPVTQIDGRVLNNGQPGETTLRLYKHLQNKLAEFQS
jgi:branched-chain amino acid aminotransferase